MQALRFAAREKLDVGRHGSTGTQTKNQRWTLAILETRGTGTSSKKLDLGNYPQASIGDHQHQPPAQAAGMQARFAA